LRRKKTENPDISSANLTQTAYMSICQMMFNKEINPGQKISFRDLAERLEMSPTPVVQALKLLQFQGLVRNEPNRGYYTEPLSIAEAKEIYELRELIEVSLIPETIKLLNEDRIKKLNMALDAHFNAVRKLYLNDRIVKDIEYHLTLASLANKPLHFKTLQRSLDLMSLKYRGNFLNVTDEDLTDKEHAEIFERIVARDVTGAQRVISQHISTVKARLIEALEQRMMERDSPYDVPWSEKTFSGEYSKDEE